MGSDRIISRGLVRPPAASYLKAISSSHASIDVALARTQHEEYCQALRATGLTVTVLPADERYPDSCFMQDPAMVIAGRAIVCRMGTASRRGEEAGAAEALAEHGFAPVAIQAPGTLEGGDVLILPDRVLVGQTARSNPDGIAQLAGILASQDVVVTGVPVNGYLHLLSAVAYLGDNRLLAAPEFADHPAFAGLEIIPVAAEDIYAVNVLPIGRNIIMPAGYPRVAQALTGCGYTVLPVPMSEFAKADGGVTCLSLVW